MLSSEHFLQLCCGDFFGGGDGGECLWVGLWVFCSVVMLAKYFLAYHNPFEITGSC